MNMEWTCALQTLLLACVVTTGYCILTETIPPSGSNIAGFENEENITVFCEVFNEQNVSQITRWHRAFEGDSLILISIVGDPQFTITGDPIPGLALSFATNLTIVSLTADLDQMLLFCGIPGNERAATFTMRIYRPPSLQDLPEQIAVEGDPLTVDLELLPEAFPFPQSVQWYKDGEAAANNTDRTLGYPNAVFDQVNRDDAGMYTLTATNNRLDNDSVEIGTDSASFNLTVIFGPEFDDDIESPSDAAVLQNDTVILVCGKNLAGFPNPDIEWRDNNGALISNGGRYTFSDSPDVVSLTISDTTASDAGNWSCNVSVTGPNGESTDIQLERIIELVVVLPPSAPFQVTADPVNIGPTFILISWQIQESALGTPPVSFFRIFVQPLNVNFTTEDGTVRDFNVTGLLPGTEYEFIVTAVSVSGEIEGESEPSSPRIGTTIVTALSPDCNSYVNITGSGLERLETGTNVCFICFFDGPGVIDTGTQWTIGNPAGAVPSEDGSEIDGVLVIFDLATVFDQSLRLLLCEAGDGSVYETAVSRAAFVPPTIDGLTVVNETDTLALLCDTSQSAPVPSPSWLDPSGTEVSTGASLVIENMDRTQAGLYTCVIMQGLNELSANVTVTVQYAPDVSTTVSSPHLSPRDQPLSLSCDYDGVPPPDITWLFEGTTLLESVPRVTIVSTESHSDFTLSGLMESEAGLYSCRASNLLGMDSVEITVTVQVIHAGIQIPQMTYSAKVIPGGGAEGYCSSEQIQTDREEIFADVQALVDYYLGLPQETAD